MTVRDKAFGSKYSGTIVAVHNNGRTVEVAWHGTIVTEEWETDRIDILS